MGRPLTRGSARWSAPSGWPWCLAVGVLVLMTGCAQLTSVVHSWRTGERRGMGEGDPAQLAAWEDYLSNRAVVANSGDPRDMWVAVLPFRNNASFPTDFWDLEQEMAQMMSAEMTGLPGWQVVPPLAVMHVTGDSPPRDPAQILEVGRSLQADLVLVGTIDKFDAGRFSAGDPLLGGYKSYTGTAHLTVNALRVADGTDLGAVDTRQEVVERGVGLDLLGKPREQDLGFTGLRTMDFGSEEFQTTPIGQATVQAVADLGTQLASLVRLSRPRLEGLTPEILSVHDSEVFINIGSANGVYRSCRFNVFPGPTQPASGPLGVVEVEEVVGAGLSRVLVLEGAGRIQVGNVLRLMEAH
jgi:hypothetical protein